MVRGRSADDAGRGVLRARLVDGGTSEEDADRQVGPIDRSPGETGRLLRQGLAPLSEVPGRRRYWHDIS